MHRPSTTSTLFETNGLEALTVLGMPAAASEDSRGSPSSSDQQIKIASIDIGMNQVLALVCEPCRDPEGNETFHAFWDTVAAPRSGATRSPLAADPPPRSVTTTRDDKRALLLPRFVQDTHVTLAHRSRLSQAALRDVFDPLLGQPVKVRVTALLWSRRIAALAVDLPEQQPMQGCAGTSGWHGDWSPRRLCQNAFPHITIWLEEGVEAKESNELPHLVTMGQAWCVHWPVPVTLEGVVSLWMMDGGEDGLTNGSMSEGSRDVHC